MNRSSLVIGGLGLLVALAALGLWLRSAPALLPTPTAAPEPVAQTAEPPAPAASTPVARQALEAPPPAPPVAGQDAEHLLSDLFGRKTVLGLFMMDDFATRVVATVDNLGLEHAPARLWPVQATAGRFLTETRNGATVISADNGLRYTHDVLLLETVDLRRLAAVYRSLYPELQQAYVNLGYPRRQFNDRLLEVLDQLIATPVPTAPLHVHLPAIEGPLQPARPWVLYEFDDPALQALNAGQRLLLRTGPVNQRRLQSRLAELRRLLASAATAH